MMWPTTPILMCALVGIVAIGMYLVLLGLRYGWRELRAPEAWAMAVLVGVGMFLIAMLHPAWIPRDTAAPGGSRRAPSVAESN
jgi:multisubunit Na+/H+ antiporter MnhB subunit